MIRRKIEKRLEEFYEAKGRYALLVDGARQVGKTCSIEEFGRTHYDSVVKIDFVKTPDAVNLFRDVADESEVLTRISAFADKPMIPGRTLVFFDEVQKCSEVVTFIKYLVKDDGRFHYVLSGSLLGVELKNIRSVPVGTMDEVTMYPLDFEEFVLAVGGNGELVEAARIGWEERRPVAKVLHDRLMRFFRLYLVVGGMPAAVQRYIVTKDIRQVVAEQQAILVEYRKDISQYDESNALRIRMVFDRIAPELSKRNKRFCADSLPEAGRFDRLEDEFVWLAEAGVALPTYNVSEPKMPLRLAEKPNAFKLFMNDVGLLAAIYMDGIQLRILNGEADMNFGAVYENVVAQELVAHGFRLAYYTSRVYGEVDFVVEYKGGVLPIEVKCGKDYARHRALNRVLGVDDYGIAEAIVFDRDALRKDDRVFYAPIYMMMFLQKDILPEKMIYEI